MKRFCVLMIILVCAASCTRHPDKWRIVPGRSAGPITENSTEDGLIELFGKENVKRKKIYIGEGQFLNGHILFEGSRNECALLWENNLTPPVDRIILSRSGGDWHLENGLSVGTTIDRLNELNGRPFLFYGFDWEMGGLVISWENGEMNPVSNDSLVLHLAPEKNKNTALPNALLGDKEIRSDSPALADIAVRVSRMEVLLQRSEPKRGIIIAENGLILRDSPGLDGLRQASIPFDAEVEIIDSHGPLETIDDITAHWLKVRYRQFEGWVFGGYVDLIQ